MKSQIAAAVAVLGFSFAAGAVTSQVATPDAADTPISQTWAPDQGDGSYRNPILHADYSDPDVVRVGEDFYMTASSFNCVPGLPILHSKDLVSWRLIGHALPQQIPVDVFSEPQHGNGCWAPAIRYRDGEFRIYYPDPDYGIYLVKAKNPAGPWSEPLLVKRVRGWIDPCPFWDDDGAAYLISALAGSRSGIKSILVISRLSPDGAKTLDDGVLVFDGHGAHPTIEGPKMYKRNGYYYIFAPAGGVEKGWQLALRSRHIYGPYEAKIVLAQGETPINGPHQGAWVETPEGESWFIHFQDKGAYGRIVHLQPLRWVDDWPVMGEDKDGDGKGEPVQTYRKPKIAAVWPAVTPPESDEFSTARLGLQWQWQANRQPNWAFPAAALGFLRLFNAPAPEGFRNLWDAPNLLLQKFPAPEFTVTTKLKFSPQTEGERTGLIVMGLDYAYVALEKNADGLHLVQKVCKEADKGSAEKQGPDQPVSSPEVYLRVRVSGDAVCQFSYSADGKEFLPVGEPFRARPGKWIGAKVGLFAIRTGFFNEAGYADYDWFRVEK